MQTCSEVPPSRKKSILSSANFSNRLSTAECVYDVMRMLFPSISTALTISAMVVVWQGISIR